MRASPLRLAALALLASAAPTAVPAALAQTVETGYGTATALPVGARNSVATLEVAAGRLYAGPRLVVVEADGRFRFEGGDPAFEPAGFQDAVVYALDAAADGRVLVGLGFNDATADSESVVPSAAGLAVSDDGGQTWRARRAPLDQPTDTTVVYGASTLPAVPLFAPGDSPPYGVALDTLGSPALYSANGLAGLRASVDDGRTWTRVVLPPDTARTLRPDAPAQFVVAPAGTCIAACETEQPVISQFGFNFIAYAVHVDEAGDVWAGTLAGLNRSSDLDPTTGDGSWVRYDTDAARPSPVGGFCTRIVSREIAGARDEVWAACWPSGRPAELAPNAEDERFGVTVWRGDDPDTGAPLFETVLLGERVYDLAFRGETAYAAGQNALFVSDDGGREWRGLRVFRGADGRPLSLRPGAAVLSVAVQGGALWAGTADGLLRSTDDGVTWELFRADVPPAGDAADPERFPAAEAVAYPNPFSPRNDRLARVRVDLATAGDVRLRVFDFEMRLVREIAAPGRPAGANEILWDGTDSGGTRVANGAYLYVVDAGGQRARGKLLVLD